MRVIRNGFLDVYSRESVVDFVKAFGLMVLLFVFMVFGPVLIPLIAVSFGIREALTHRRKLKARSKQNV
jgi:hypothetical protein